MTAPDATAADVVTNMFAAIDELDWDTFRSSFAAGVTLDYTSLWGGEPETVAPGDLAAQWEDLAYGYDATQHLTGPIVVRHADPHTATCRTTVRAYHHVVQDDGNAATWIVAGRYEIGMARGSDGWKIEAITLSVAYEEGDRRLVDIARQRTASGSGGRTAQR